MPDLCECERATGQPAHQRCGHRRNHSDVGMDRQRRCNHVQLLTYERPFGAHEHVNLLGAPIGRLGSPTTADVGLGRQSWRTLLRHAPFTVVGMVRGARLVAGVPNVLRDSARSARHGLRRAQPRGCRRLGSAHQPATGYHGVGQPCSEDRRATFSNAPVMLRCAREWERCLRQSPQPYRKQFGPRQGCGGSRGASAEALGRDLGWVSRCWDWRCAVRCSLAK